MQMGTLSATERSFSWERVHRYRIRPLHAVLMNLLLLIGLATLCECSRKDSSIRLMSFNVWTSGKSVYNGLQKIARHIKKVRPDIVAMQEISDEAGLDYIVTDLADNWNWVRCTTSETWFPDVAILTNLKIVGPCTATSRAIAIPVETRTGRSLLIWNAHFNYKMFGPLAAQMKMVKSSDQLLSVELLSGRVKNAQEVLDHPLTNEWQRRNQPIVVAGDFNTPSHLDWIEATRKQHGGWVVRWPVTQLFERAGFHDAYRTLYPDANIHPGHTWSPIQRFSKEWGYKYIPEPQDRLDYVFHSGPIRAVNATLYCGTEPLTEISTNGRYKRNDYPSDHYALIVELVM
ncbi:hypothetical protein Y032_0018g3521 [Ancylostoma ceylanicum]|nr:hypothetical protein Y032_0018g3521 [Ancylostoma ceylanicum]